MKITTTQTIQSLEPDCDPRDANRYSVTLFSSSLPERAGGPYADIRRLHCPMHVAEKLHIGQTVKIELDFGD